MILNSDDIKKVIAKYFKDKPVKKVWLFGSYARNEADDASDVDVLIDFEENKWRRVALPDVARRNRKRSK